jgi:hypothetical protein
MITYLGAVQPFESPLLNYLDIFNEICLLGIGYHLTFFTEYESNFSIRYNVGWSVIMLTLLNFLVNAIVIFIESFIRLKVAIKRLYSRYFKSKAKKTHRNYLKDGAN